jgi:sporulation protein YlmC with PRC-barrel domain
MNQTGQQRATTQPYTGLDRAEYRSWTWLNDADVVNPSGEEIADVEDLIIDRGTGRIELVVLRTGSILGLGGRTFTVPFDEFQWHAQSTRLTLNSSPAQLGSYPTYNTEEWKSLRNSEVPIEWLHRGDPRRGYAPGAAPGTDGRGMTGRSGNAGIDERGRIGTSGAGTSGAGAAGTPGGAGQTGSAPQQTGQQPGSNQNAQNQAGTGQNQRGANQPGPNDPNPTTQSQSFNDWMWRNTRPGGESYSPQWGNAQTETITGQIRSVARQGEHVIVEVLTQDGMTRHVALGPSWFISGGQAALNRGDTIRVEAVPLVVARSAEINGQRIELRDQQGAAAWSQGQFRAGEERFSAPYARYLRVSDLVGADIDCRGADCGDVSDVIIEIGSGSIAFLSIDPDDNFLGIGDTNRLVPWAVANVSVNGTVRLDVTKEMMTSTMETPADAATLNAPGAVDRIYRSYGVPDVRWEPRQPGYFNRGWGDDRDR